MASNIERGPLILIAAGLLMFCGVVAYALTHRARMASEPTHRDVIGRLERIERLVDAMARRIVGEGR